MNILLNIFAKGCLWLKTFIIVNWFWFAVLAAVILFWLYIKKVKNAMDKKFQTTLRDDILRALGENVNSCPLVFSASTTDKNFHSPLNNLPADVLRVEYEIKKTEPNKVTRTVAVAFKQEEDVILRQAGRVIAWDDLPSEVRRMFIRENKDSLHFSLFNRNEKESRDE